MIGISKQHETIRLLQDDAVALRSQIATLTHQLEVLSAQLLAQQERLGGCEAREIELENRIAALTGIVADQAEALALQGNDLDRLNDVGERRDEEVRQTRGHIARLERQAAIDLDEMRQADKAIAASMLLRRPLSHFASGIEPDHAL